MTPRFIAENLALPRGLPGRLLAGSMNRRNRAMNEYAVQCLALDPADRVLEVGFGGGVNLAALLAGSAAVVGIDPSPLTIRLAERHHAPAVAAGRATFKPGRAERLPVADGAFDKLLTVNTVYFWESLAKGCAEFARVLRPGGRAVIGFLPREHMDRMKLPSDLFAPRHPEEVASALTEAGFTEVSVDKPEADAKWVAVSGSCKTKTVSLG